MSAQVYCVHGQTEWRKKAFLEWTSIDLSSKLSFTCGGNFNYYKVFVILLLLCRNREHPGNFQNKSASSPFNWLSRYILFLAKLKVRESPFMEGARSGAALWNYPKEYLVVIKDEKFCPFLKFETILPLLCCLLEPLTNKNCRIWSSVMNLWIDFRTRQKYRILQSAR